MGVKGAIYGLIKDLLTTSVRRENLALVNGFV